MGSGCVPIMQFQPQNQNAKSKESIQWDLEGCWTDVEGWCKQIDCEIGPLMEHKISQKDHFARGGFNRVKSGHMEDQELWSKVHTTAWCWCIGWWRGDALLNHGLYISLQHLRFAERIAMNSYFQEHHPWVLYKSCISFWARPFASLVVIQESQLDVQKGCNNART